MNERRTGSESRMNSQALLLILFLMAIAPLNAQEIKVGPRAVDGFGLHILANQELAAVLSVGGRKERVTGRISIHIAAAPDVLREGQVEVVGANIVFTGVSQKLLGTQATTKQPLGVLGFALQSGEKRRLRYDPKTGRIAGELKMFLDASFLSAYAEPVADSRGDLFLTPTAPVIAALEIELGKPLPERSVESRILPGSLNLKLTSAQFTYGKLAIPAIDLRLLEAARIDWELASVYLFEVAQNLCVQPVRLLRFNWGGWFPIFQISGIGLAFGEPGARAEWRKDDVTFSIREWKTIDASNYWELNPTEAASLRAEVEDDDCIEVFFVNSLDPDDKWGGGATWGSGTASSQVISSDDNARGGIDLTHLGHELGHVLGLLHPGDPSTTSAVAGSSGTLMCPSGYLRDNPRVNSQENEDRVSNPLLVFSLKFIGPGPDCLDSADCGQCP